MKRNFIYEDELPAGYSIMTITSRFVTNPGGVEGAISKTKYSRNKLIFGDDSHSQLAADAPASFEAALEVLTVIADYCEKHLPLPRTLSGYLSAALRETVSAGFGELAKNKGVVDEVVTGKAAAVLATQLNIKALNKRPALSFERFWGNYQSLLDDLAEVECDDKFRLMQPDGKPTVEDKWLDKKWLGMFFESRKKQAIHALKLAAKQCGISEKTAKRYISKYEKYREVEDNKTYFGRVFRKMIDLDKSPGS